MTVRDGLVLDHLYLSLDSTPFESLATVFAQVPGAARAVVKSGGDSWEGLYIRSRTGLYFEFLRQRRQGGLGVAASAYASSFLDVRKVVAELPDLAWKTGTRVTEGGEPWFDWLSLGEYLDIDETRFNAWIMHYHPCHFVPTKPRVRPAVDGFTNLTVSVGPEMRSEIAELGAWLPGTAVGSGRCLTLQLPDRDGGVLAVQIDFTGLGRQFEFGSLTWWPTRGVSFPEISGGPWRIEGLGDGQIRLSANR